jgi:hypothetical protein
LQDSQPLRNRKAREKIKRKKNDEDKVAEMTTEGESEEATEQPNKSKENRKRNATINERERERERDGGRRRRRRRPREKNFRCKENKTFPTGHAEFLYTYLPVTVCPVDRVGKTAARRPISFLGNYLNIGRYLVDIYLPTYLSLSFLPNCFYHSSKRLPP